jgi:hypothetical protein
MIDDYHHSKIGGEGFKRNSLIKYHQILKQYFDRCFYCGNSLSIENVAYHVDHFIPWSYIYEDELWNLGVPNEKYIKRLVKRNLDYSNVIDDLEKSVKRLAAGGDHEQIINKYYQNCLVYGFTKMNP